MAGSGAIDRDHVNRSCRLGRRAFVNARAKAYGAAAEQVHSGRFQTVLLDVAGKATGRQLLHSAAFINLVLAAGFALGWIFRGVLCTRRGGCDALANERMAALERQIEQLERLADWRKRARLSPYGAGALAGNTLGLDPNLVAQELGLAGANALTAAGAQEQAQRQAEINAPLTQATNVANLMKGYNVPVTTTEKFTGPIAGVYGTSPLAQVTGLGTLIGSGLSDTTKVTIDPTTGKPVTSTVPGWLTALYNKATGSFGTGSIDSSGNYVPPTSADVPTDNLPPAPTGNTPNDLNDFYG